jgi:hypothetical protein
MQQLTFMQIAYALDTKNQDAAAVLNGHMANLTTETMDDNATVKLITVFSLIYLPGSFVGVSRGPSQMQSTAHLCCRRCTE